MFNRCNLYAEDRVDRQPFFLPKQCEVAMRRIRTPEKAEALRKRGSRYAPREGEEVKLIPMEGPYLTDFIRAAVLESARHGMSPRELCNECDISEPTLSTFLSGKRGASAETLNRIVWALGLRVAWPEGSTVRIPKGT